MRALKWTVILTFILMLVAVLHYALPRSEVVRIVGVTQRQEALGWNGVFFASTPAGQGEGITRDIRLIETIRPGGTELVFRNEDTGWLWPPYFKFNSADLQARGRDLNSQTAEPIWVAVKYYGVRSLLASIYPNVLRIDRVEGPEVRIIPWTRIIFLTALFVGLVWLWFTLGRRRDAIRDVHDDEDVIIHATVPPPRPTQGTFGRFWQRLTGH